MSSFGIGFQKDVHLSFEVFTDVHINKILSKWFFFLPRLFPFTSEMSQKGPFLFTSEMSQKGPFLFTSEISLKAPFCSDLLELWWRESIAVVFNALINIDCLPQREFVGCLTSQQNASVSQRRICSGNFTCCHTEIEVANPTFHLTQSQYADTGPTGRAPGSQLSVNFEATDMTRPRKNSAASGIRTRDLPLSRGTP